VPTISSFYGILIRMFFNDHAPPHFHVQYAEFKATVDIMTLTISSGNCRAERKNLFWIGQNCIKKNCLKIGSYAWTNSSQIKLNL